MSVLNKDMFYDLLSKENQNLFDQVETHEILGASNHLEIIGKMFLDIANNSSEKNRTLDESIEILDSLANYYNTTRGNASRAIYNGILTMLKGINKKELQDQSELLTRLSENIKGFEKLNKDNLDKILDYANSELSEYKNILLFDYSSTVEKSIGKLAQNSEKDITLYISESSAIDGGRPFFKLNKYSNVNIIFFPDAALYYNLKLVDCCLMGAETFYPDGTGFNTIGSDMVGVLCTEINIPLYFITPLNKLDIRRKSGQRKELVYIDYKSKYKNPEAVTDDMNTVTPELTGVVPSNIYAYICEEGVIPSNQMFQISLDYDKNLRGVNNG